MKDFYEHIRTTYDKNTCHTIKHNSKLQKQLAKQKERLKYLLRCKDYGINPPHLERKTARFQYCFKLDLTRKELRKIETEFLNKILKLEIRETNIQINIIKKNLEHIHRTMKTKLNTQVYNSIITNQNKNFHIVTKKTNINLENKLQKQITENIRRFGLILNRDWLINKTEIELPEDSEWLLSLGEKFALPTTKNNFSTIHTIADIEQSIQTMEDETEKVKARHELATKIHNFRNKITHTPLEKFLIQTYEKTKKLINQHKDEIIITRADKGNKTVIMHKEHYKTKMQEMLDDRTTYKTLRTDPTQQLLRKNNKLINELYKNKYIDIGLKYKLSCSAANAPRLYGLPKTHKEGLPLRPISSSTNVPCYNLAKHLGTVLKNIISEVYNTKNSETIKNDLKELKIENDEIMVSFDVISLFTNIPTQTAIRTILQKWTKLEPHTTIPKKQFQCLLEFCLRDNNYFTYNKTFYTQVFGMPMGNPLSPTIADILLDEIIDDSITELKNNKIHIKYIKKYVDDVFAIVKEKDIEKILKTLNSQHRKIQFTIEKEQNNCLAYLDIKIHKIGDTMKINWNMKETASGRIINFNSNHPKSQKINTATNLIRKIYTISDEQFKAENYIKIKTLLYKNGYPKTLIDKLIEKTTNKIKNNNSTKQKNTDNEPKQYFGVPYIPKLTSNKELKNLIRHKNIQYAHRPNHTLKTMFTNTKDKIEKTKQSNVTYEIKCKGSETEQCKLIYVGTTKRALETRINEHKTDMRNKKLTTALAQHLTQKNHLADFDNIIILDIERNHSKRMTLESLRIQQKINTTMNYKEDKDGTNKANQWTTLK